MGVRKRRYPNQVPGAPEIDLPDLKQWDFDVRHAKPRGKVYLLETDLGPKCLKVREKSEGEVHALFLLLEHLARHGFSRIPRFIRTKFGEPFIKGKNGFYWVSDWIYGRGLNPADRNDVIKAVGQLAHLHRAGAGFTLPSEYSGGLVAASWLREFSCLATKLVDLKTRVRGNAILTPSLQAMAARALVSCRLLHEAGYVQLKTQAENGPGFCHGSYDRDHIILDPAGELFVTGFDRWNKDLPLNDLVQFILLVGPEYRWDSKVIRGMVVAYDLINPLYPAEMEMIQACLCFPSGYWELLQKLAREVAGPDQTREAIEVYAEQDALKHECLMELTREIEAVRG